MNQRKAVVEIRKFLEEYLCDPLSRGLTWIYDDSVEVDLNKSSLPVVYVKKGDVPKTRSAIGNPSSLDRANIEVEVKALVGHKYAYKSEVLKGEEFAFALLDEVESLIKYNHDYFVSKGFLHLIPLSVRVRFDMNRNPVPILVLEAFLLN